MSVLFYFPKIDSFIEYSDARRQFYSGRLEGNRNVIVVNSSNGEEFANTTLKNAVESFKDY